MPDGEQRQQEEKQLPCGIAVLALFVLFIALKAFGHVERRMGPCSTTVNHASELELHPSSALEMGTWELRSLLSEQQAFDSGNAILCGFPFHF